MRVANNGRCRILVGQLVHEERDTEESGQFIIYNLNRSFLEMELILNRPWSRSQTILTRLRSFQVTTSHEMMRTFKSRGLEVLRAPGWLSWT